MPIFKNVISSNKKSNHSFIKNSLLAGTVLLSTAGQDVFNFSHDIIQRQMGHEIGDKVRKAYDRSKCLEKRLDFLNTWCDSLADMGL